MPGPTWLLPALRGAFALTLPLLVGLRTGHPVIAVIAAVGALWGVGQDGEDPYWSRTRRLLWLALAAAVGTALGALALRSGGQWPIAAVLVLTALVGGAISGHGRTASVAGMHLLLGAVIGSAIAVPGPWWLGAVALLAGVLEVLVLSSIARLWAPHRAERDAVRAVFEAASRALAAAGTSGAEDARRGLTAALDHAQVVMSHYLVRAARSPLPPPPPIGRLMRAHHLAVPLGHPVTTLLWEGRTLPEAVIAAPLQMAERLLGPDPAHRVPAGPGRWPEPATPGLRALAHALRGADLIVEPEICAEMSGAPGPGVEDAPTAPALAALPLSAAAGRPAPRLQIRYALLLALSVLIAQGIAVLLHGPRAYWLPMTVAFVYKPDLGPVLLRSLHRCLGTVAGVAGIGAVALLTTDPYLLLVGVGAFGALMAYGVRRHYAVATTGLTGVVFVLLDLLGDSRDLYGSRILDTALAAVVVLAVHFALWPRSAVDRARALTQDALATVERYRDLAPQVSPMHRHMLRREAYRQLAQARQAIGSARRELRPGARSLALHHRQIIAAERDCDRVTAGTALAA